MIEIQTDVIEFLRARWLVLKPNTDKTILLRVVYIFLYENIYDIGFVDYLLDREDEDKVLKVQ